MAFPIKRRTRITSKEAESLNKLLRRLTGGKTNRPTSRLFKKCLAFCPEWYFFGLVPDARLSLYIEAYKKNLGSIFYFGTEKGKHLFQIGKDDNVVTYSWLTSPVPDTCRVFQTSVASTTQIAEAASDPSSLATKLACFFPNYEVMVTASYPGRTKTVVEVEFKGEVYSGRGTFRVQKGCDSVVFTPCAGVPAPAD